jgi:hypothetical protein
MKEPENFYCDVVFVTSYNPLAWYERNAQRARLHNVSFVVFQIEHCAETNACCLRGFAQSEHRKTTAAWREDLELDPDADVRAAPGSTKMMAKRCMTAGVDADNRQWTVLMPHVVLGVAKVRQAERLCLDLIDGDPDSVVAARYPRPWRIYRKSIESFKRIINDCAQADDEEIASRWIMMAPIVHDVCAHRDFFYTPMPSLQPPPPPSEFRPESFLVDYDNDV